MRKQRRPDRNHPASFSDWNKVWALEWSNRYRKVLRKIQETGFRGLGYQEAGEHLHSCYMSINTKLRTQEIPYVLASIQQGRGRSFLEESWTLFCVKK